MHVYVLLAYYKSFMAGTAAGLFRTPDQGKMWQRLANGLPKGASIVALPAGGSYLFTGCRDKGIFVSKDLGDSWAPLNDALGAKGSARLLLLPLPWMRCLNLKEKKT